VKGRSKIRRSRVDTQSKRRRRKKKDKGWKMEDQESGMSTAVPNGLLGSLEASREPTVGSSLN
jgi:hypothetical protein